MASTVTVVSLSENVDVGAESDYLAKRRALADTRAHPQSQGAAKAQSQPVSEDEDDESGAAADASAKQALREQAQRDIAALLEVVRTVHDHEDAVESAFDHHDRAIKLPLSLTHGATPLRPHQMEGVQWMWARWRSGLGGCVLADEMGLGKTAQALALLACLHDRHMEARRARAKARRGGGAVRRAFPTEAHWRDIPVLSKLPDEVTRTDLGSAGPHLIIAPTSLVSNWAAEARRFANRMSALVLRGSRSERHAIICKLRAHPSRYNLVITSTSMISDSSIYAALSDAVRSWGALVVDEAHSLKNPLTRRFQRVARINAEFRLLLTGTPVQNNIEEMLTLLRLVAADLFGASASSAGSSPKKEHAFNAATDEDHWTAFVEAFVDELSRHDGTAAASSSSASQSASLISSINAMTRMFILQRTKHDVALKLPPKRSEVVSIPMTAVQSSVYQAVKRSLHLASLRRVVMVAQSSTSAVATTSTGASAMEAVLAGPFVGSVTGPAAAGKLLPGPLMLLRRAASHPLLLRTAYPDDVVLALTRVAFSLDGGRVVLSRPAPGSVPPARRSSTYANLADESFDQAMLESDTTWLQPPSEQPQCTPQAATREQLLSMLSTAAARAGMQLEREPSPSTAVRIRYQQHPARSQPPTHDSLVDLVAWAGGDRLLAKQAEQALAMSDFEISEQLCAFYDDLDCWRLPASALHQCGKMQRLLSIVRDMRSRGSKLLVFSQFNIVLDLISAALDGVAEPHLRLDGSTAAEERQKLCDRFQAPGNEQVFLLTTKTGGMGLNLTAADTVVIYDCDWNPQNDRQAEDRAHRMGQTQPVTVHRLVSHLTIEARMLRVAEQKRKLEKAILGKDADVALESLIADEIDDRDLATQQADGLTPSPLPAPPLDLPAPHHGGNGSDDSSAGPGGWWDGRETAAAAPPSKRPALSDGVGASSTVPPLAASTSAS